MTNKQSVVNKITSVFLTVAILLTMVPMTAITSAAATINSNRVADASTMDSWKEFFSTEGNISTENAGGVWTDKSVFTDASAFAGTGITQKNKNSFLVALSTMAATMSVTGVSSTPTDTMLVLDVSGSMNGDSGNNDAAQSLINSANYSIKTLLNTNAHNRVGVVLYSGPSTVGGSASAGDAIVILPLGRYTTGTNGEYLSYGTRTGKNPSGNGNRTFEQVILNSNVRVEGSGSSVTSVSKDVYGGTYIQKGVILAMNQFTASSNTVTVNDPVLGTLKRKPVLVLMSDGAPTVGSRNFTNPDTIHLGNGSGTSAALGFVSQLSASYAKAKIEEKYDNDALFYTLGLGLGNDGVAIGVLDPTNEKASASLADFWNKYNKLNITDSDTKNDSVLVQSSPQVSITKIATVLEQNYVDKYFSAESEILAGGQVVTLQDKLELVFKDIITSIQLQSGYFPTLIAENKDLSGYVSFVDKIGQYMEVTDIKGILLGNHLFSGAELASNFVSGGGALGSYSTPTELGLEMVSAVRTRLGLESDEDARTLIFLAYENGQLSYTDKNNFSNYIGWYANTYGEFLGFYNEGTTVLPTATGNPATDPAYVVKSYGYLGEVDESHGVTESDMMYATVQVRERISNGEQLVTFAVPAALIPTISYNVTLDEGGNLSDLNLEGADSPIRLVYEVALKDGINSFNVKEVLSDEYLADPHNVNADGSVNFYSNQWDHENKTEYGTVNTYSYFNPSRQNERYYYLEDTIVYSDTNGNVYEGSKPTDSDKLYRCFNVYKNNGSLRTEVQYRELSNAAKATAVKHDDGYWYIPKGNVHVNLDGYTVHKDTNKTGTLTEVYVPFVDTENHNVNDAGYNFFVGATHGNNGKFTLIPETGIKLTKTMASGAAEPEKPFTFSITNESDDIDSTLPAWLIKANGEEQDITVKFNNGKATVELEAGDILYIGGMTAGDVYKIEENETIEYVASSTGLSSVGTVNISASEIKSVSFVNDDRGTGNLTIGKEVIHDYGTNYQIPADKTFIMEVTLSGIGTSNAVFNAEHTNGSFTQITTDGSGKFTVQLRHDEQLEVYGLPAGTTASVVEKNIGNGFSPVYRDNDVIGDGIVTVVADSTVSVIVENDYIAERVYPVNISVTGNKTLVGRTWQSGDKFEFRLEKLLENGTWEQLGATVNATPGNTAFEFTDAFTSEEYTKIGVYYYRVVEVEPTVPIGGITYDKTVHSFSVHVEDADMDGKLEIAEVRTDRPTTTVVTQSTMGWNVDASFTNTYSTSGIATVTIDVNKIIDNVGGSEKSLAGYTFGLFDSNTGVQTGNLLATTERGFARFVLTYTAADLGTGDNKFTYILKEIAPDPVPNGWIYSTEEYKVTVEVIDNGDGTITGVIYTETEKPVDADESISVNFTNKYDPRDTELEIDFVNKVLNGRGLVAGEFDFEVQLLDGTKVLEGTNSASGKVNFNSSLKFDKVGVYEYMIVETSPDGNGVISDKDKFHIIVTVTDNNGALNARYVLTTVIGDIITFENTYIPTTVNHVIKGTKTLRGRHLINDEFTFTMRELTFDGAAVANPQVFTAKNFTDGTFEFPNITYTKAGTYTYSVEEVVPEGGKVYGIHYDTTQYKVTVVVEDNGDGTLSVKSEKITLLNNTSVNALTFLNEYKADPTWAQFTGEKQLTGKVNNALNGGEFEFELYNSDADWTIGSIRETVANGANGLITFNKIDFDTAGNQYFVVVEKNGGQTIDGITYDDSKFNVWVEVIDDLKGNLHTTVHIFDSEGIPQDKIAFVNIYKVTGESDVTLSGEKTLNGREWTDGDSFTFELFETDNSYESVGTKVGSDNVKFDDADRKYEIKLSYTSDDVGKTYYYILKENNSNPIAGINYSNTVYNIKVIVEDDDMGGVKTTVSVINATTTTLNFVNTYTVSGTASVELSGEKTLYGREWTDSDSFTVELYETDANYANLGTVITTDSVNKTDKQFTLNVEYGVGDVGKSFYYVVKEQNSGKVIDGVTYSTAEYKVKVTVSDNGDGTIKATSEVVDGFVDELDFTNSYTSEKTSAGFEGTKTLNTISGVRELKENDFTFELFAANEQFEITGSAIQTVKNGADGKFSFAEVEFEAVGTYRFVVKENSQNPIGGVVYDNTQYHITVEVTDNGRGNLVAETTILKVKGNVSESTGVITFVNEYDITSGVVVQFEAEKVLEGKDLGELKFSFELVETDGTWANGTVLQTKENNSNHISFDKIEYMTVGEHFYLVREKNAGQTISGISYDETVYRIYVKTIDNLDGTLSKEVSVTKVEGTNETVVNGIEFVNTYTVSGTASVELSGEKTLNGREWTDSDSFTVELYETDANYANLGTVITTDSVNKTDKQFTLNVEYGVGDVGKSFYYVVKEQNSGKVIDGVTYSTAEYKVKVTVNDNGDGTIKATSEVVDGFVDELDFTNSYTSEKTSAGFEGTKTLNTISGVRELKENDFTFELFAANEQFEITGSAIQTVKNGADGKFSFAEVEFEAVGTYRFVVKENSQNPIGGVVYDNTQYHITVEVTDNGRGNLVAETTILKVKGNVSEPTGVITFVNEYDAESVNVNISGIKELIGRDISDGEFAFIMVETDKNFSILEGTLEMVTFNKADSTFTFDAISFTETGKYYFVIREDDTVAAERVVFDDAVYYVTIEVTDDENGKLVASDSVIVKLGSNEEITEIKFTNVYVPRPSDITVDIDVHKTVINKNESEIGPEGFEFLLKSEFDGVDGISVKTDENGEAKFTLTFTEDDIGKVYNYKITEVNTGRDGVVYSTVEYLVKIEVYLEKDTNTLAVKLFENGTETTKVVTEFENVYEGEEDGETPYNPPATGDDTKFVMWTVMMIISGGAVLTLLLTDNKKKRVKDVR